VRRSIIENRGGEKTKNRGESIAAWRRRQAAGGRRWRGISWRGVGRAWQRRRCMSAWRVTQRHQTAAAQ
jgi:hypothetical protein